MVLAGVGMSAGLPAPPTTSWSGTRHVHGWSIDPIRKDARHVRYRCTPARLRGAWADRIVCATSDGGRHWHVAFLAYNRDSSLPEHPSIRSVRRWSRTAGIVSLSFNNGPAQGHLEYWTIDNGRHWYRTDALNAGLGGGCNFASPGSCTLGVTFRSSPGKPLLYDLHVVSLTRGSGCDDCLERTDSELSYRLDGWPPRVVGRCGGIWRVSKWTRVCIDYGQPANAQMHAVQVAGA